MKTFLQLIVAGLALRWLFGIAETHGNALGNKLPEKIQLPFAVILSGGMATLAVWAGGKVIR